MNHGESYKVILGECDRLFAQIRSEHSISAICYALESLFDKYVPLEFELDERTEFWRARPAGDEPWQHERDVWYPPSEATKVGRLNDAFAPCLYASTLRETAVREIEAKEGDFVQLALFRMRESLPRVAAVGEHLHTYKTGYLRLTGKDPNGVIAGLLRSKPKTEARMITYIDAFFSAILADEDAPVDSYVRCRALASILYRNPNTDAIVYPSVCDKLATNIALRQEVADARLRVVRCEHVRITKLREFGFADYDVLSVASNIDEFGHFVWGKATPGVHRYFNATPEEARAMRPSHR